MAVTRRPLLNIVLLIGAVVLIGFGAWNWLRPAATGPGGTEARRAARPQQPVPVVTAIAEAEDLIIQRRTIGLLESPATIVVRSRIDSQVLEQHVTDGQMVRRGQLLFTLDDRELKAAIARDQATVVKDRAALTQAEADLQRRQQLAAKGIAPQQQLEQAEAAFKAARQTVEAGEAVLEADRTRLGYAAIESPMNGRLGSIRVAPGNLVPSNDPNGLATITQLAPLRVSFTLPERDVAALRAAAQRDPPAPVRLYPSGAGEAAQKPEPLASGRLNFVDSSVDTTSGTIAARATFPNTDLALWPGQYVEVEIELGRRPGTVMVPTTAILTGQRGPYTFVAKPDGTVAMREVRTGGVEGTRTALFAGLEAGERIVVQGQLRLADGGRWREAEPPARPSVAPASPVSAAKGSVE